MNCLMTSRRKDKSRNVRSHRRDRREENDQCQAAFTSIEVQKYQCRIADANCRAMAMDASTIDIQRKLVRKIELNDQMPSFSTI